MLSYNILANAETSTSENAASRSARGKEAAKLESLRACGGGSEKLQAGTMRTGDSRASDARAITARVQNLLAACCLLLELTNGQQSSWLA